MSQPEKEVSHRSRGSAFNEGSPERLVAASLVLLVVKLSILLRGDCFVAIVISGPMLWLSKEAQPIPGACASQHPRCCCTCPLYTLLGEASILRGGRFVTSTATSEAACSLAVCILCTWAQSCNKQHPNPQRGKLLLSRHQSRAAKTD